MNKKVSDAVCLAIKQHSAQTRQDGSPYIIHPIRVLAKLTEYGFGDDYQIVAALHDVIEDTDTTYEEIFSLFGKSVADAVKALSKKDGLSIEDYVKGICENAIARIVKTSDIIDNMQDVLTAPDKKWAASYVQKSKKAYYGKISRAADIAIDCAEENIKNGTTRIPEIKAEEF